MQYVNEFIAIAATTKAIVLNVPYERLSFADLGVSEAL